MVCRPKLQIWHTEDCHYKSKRLKNWKGHTISLEERASELSYGWLGINSFKILMPVIQRITSEILIVTI